MKSLRLVRTLRVAGKKCKSTWRGARQGGSIPLGSGPSPEAGSGRGEVAIGKC